MQITKIIFNLGLIFIAITHKAFAQEKNERHFTKVNFDEVAASKLDTLEFTAVVKSIYKCPPCPKGAQCKPCVGDHLEVTDNKPNHWLRVFTPEPLKYEIGRTYRFVVRFRSKWHQEDNVELVSALKQ